MSQKLEEYNLKTRHEIAQLLGLSNLDLDDWLITQPDFSNPILKVPNPKIHHMETDGDDRRRWR